MPSSKRRAIEFARSSCQPLHQYLAWLPLVLVPGAGSELYRGLGSVVVGGLSLSALLTLVIIPPLLSLTVGVFAARATKPPAPIREQIPGDVNCVASHRSIGMQPLSFFRRVPAHTTRCARILLTAPRRAGGELVTVHLK